jgi:hypothetical protein
MLAEFMREVALLVLVFVPLEFFLQASEPYRLPGTIAAALSSGALLTGGIVVERIRRG